MQVPCPQCKKAVNWEGNPHRPFCSERCKLIDLGAWADGKNAIPSDHDVSSEEDSSRKPAPTGKKDVED